MLRFRAEILSDIRQVVQIFENTRYLVILTFVHYSDTAKEYRLLRPYYRKKHAYTNNQCDMPERIVLLYFSILHKKKQEVFCNFTEIFLKIPPKCLLRGKLIAFFHKSGR